MSYSIRFKAKVEGLDRYIDTGYCTANISYNARDIIVQSTGLEWENDGNNGLVSQIIPFIMDGICELIMNREKYKRYEANNGWGTVSGAIDFFKRILNAWDELVSEDIELSKIVTFWIE